MPNTTISLMSNRRRFLKSMGLATLSFPVSSLASGWMPAPRVGSKRPKSESSGAVQLNVRDLGAAGNRQTKDTTPIQLALDRCSLLGGGTVTVPAGTYMIGAIALRSNVTLHLEEGAILQGSDDLKDYPVMQVRWEGKWVQGYSGLVYALDATNIGITGPGKIVGSKLTGGRPNAADRLRRPALIEPISCTGIVFDGFSTQYQNMWSIHVTYCNNITISNLNIRSTGGNGDGIDVDSCRNVTIDHCDIVAGDDCISLKSGRGMEGYTLARVTENVTITNCTFKGLIFACIGIGSETSGGIRNAEIRHCKFTGAKTFALYIKTKVGRGAFIEDILVDDIEVTGTEGGLLRFNLMGSGLQDEVPVPGMEGIPSTRNFRFTNIRVRDVPVLIDGVGVHPGKPLQGFEFRNVQGTCAKGMSLANIHKASIKNIDVTGYSGPLLAVYNVSGHGIKEAEILPQPKYLEAIPAPSSAYELK